MKYPLALILQFSFVLGVAAQGYSEFSVTIKKLYDPSSYDQTWNQLVQDQKIPLVVEDSVAFLYRGDAQSISWTGDFNGWGYYKEFNSKVVRIPQTDIWMLKASFPKDARLDYKIMKNGTEWMLDPNNSSHQWSGVGGGSPNSELRMPEWKEDPLTTRPLPDAQHGKIEKDILFNSKSLGYQITYIV
jgi:hypothetical protein